MHLSRILIPCDFREESFIALLHAAHLAKRTNAEIMLLHLTDNESKVAEGKLRIEELKNQLKAQYSGKVTTLVEEGDIIRKVGVIAEREDCQLVIMPTHGMKGMQEFTGSLALTVVSESSIPFIIVQHRDIRVHGYKKIVIPVEYRPELINELNAFVQTAKLFDSQVFVITHDKHNDKKDPNVLNELVAILNEENIPFEIHPSGKFDFSKAVAEYARTIDADLICSVNFASENLFSLYPRTDEEDLIYNSGQIPVMLVTPGDESEEEDDDDDEIDLDAIG